MMIVERLDRLTERHETLTQSVELKSIQIEKIPVTSICSPRI